MNAPYEASDIQELIDALDPDSRTLFAEATLGRDATDFLKSELGRYMVGCAQQEYSDAMQKLKVTAPWRRRRINELQNQIWRAESFVTWLRDLVLQGKAAEVSLDEREE